MPNPKSDGTGLQEGSMRMIREALDQRPRVARIARHEHRRRLDAAVQRVGLALAARNDLPDLFERRAGAVGELHIGLDRVRPGLAEIVARSQHAAPVHAVRSGPETMPPRARIARQRVHGVAREVRPADVPIAPARIRAQDEGAFHRADEQHDVAVSWRNMTNGWHRMSLSNSTP